MAQIHCISLTLTIAVTFTGYWQLSDMIELIWHLWMTSLDCRNILSSYCYSWWIWPMTLYILYFWIYTVDFQLPTVCCLKNTSKYDLKLTKLNSLLYWLLWWLSRRSSSMGLMTSGAEHLTSRCLSGSGSMEFLHNISHMRTQMVNNMTTVSLPFEMMLKISVVFQSFDCVILMQASCLLRYRKEYRTRFKNCLRLPISVFLNKGNSYRGNPTKEIQCPVLKKK